jgi:hypothetical protein
LRYVAAEGVNISHEIIPGSKGRRGCSRIKSPAHQYIRVRDTRGKDLDADVPLSRLRKVLLDVLQYFRAAKGGDHNTAVLD